MFVAQNSKPQFRLRFPTVNVAMQYPHERVVYFRFRCAVPSRLRMRTPSVLQSLSAAYQIEFIHLLYSHYCTRSRGESSLSSSSGSVAQAFLLGTCLRDEQHHMLRSYSSYQLALKRVRTCQLCTSGCESLIVSRVTSAQPNRLSARLNE